MSPIEETLNYIKSQTTFIPKFGIILGTGLGHLADKIIPECIIDYHQIPHFPISTVETHQGKLIFGTLNGMSVVAMQGRFHFYEGYTMKQVTYPVRIMKLLGIECLLISNVSGGLNNTYNAGDLVIIEDHINLQSDNPLIGKNNYNWGPRFPDMFEPYNKKLIQLAIDVAKEKSIKIHQGVYVSVCGPNLETKAEYRFLRMIGADIVGMSTVPEVIVAVHMQIPTFAISIVTDLCYEPKLKKTNLEEILNVANSAEPHLTYIIEQMVSRINL